MKKLLTEQGATQAWTCCCNGQSHEIGGIQTHFFQNGSTCNSAPGGCANQTLQPNGSSNMVPWNLVDPNANSGYGQGAGTSFPGNGQLNGQTPIGIWSVNNTYSCTNGGNDFGEPYIWFTQNLMDPNDPSKCLPNPANCRTATPPQHKGCIDPNALNDGECCNGDPNCTPVAHSAECCRYERIDNPVVNECCKWCQTGPFTGNPPQGCEDWMCTDPQWLSDNCPDIEPKDKDKFLELREEIKRIKELL